MQKVPASFAQPYAEQLDDIGRMRVRAKLVTRHEIQRHGVRFALQAALFPPEKTHARRK